MALLPCPECQHDVSDKAAACPHCGLPLSPRPPRQPISSRARQVGVLGGVALGLFMAGGVIAMLRRTDHARVEELRAEQDAQGGTRNEHVRQRAFRLYTEHPGDAMYAYLWARCVDDTAKQLEIAEQGMRADPRFSWNYNLAARALARLHRVPEAYALAVKGAALDPGNMQLADKQTSLKLILDHKLDAQARPAPSPAARYTGLFHGMVRSPDRPDLQAIEKSRLADLKGPVSDVVKGFTVCANTFADACMRVYVPADARFGSVWRAPALDVTTLKDHQVVTLTGAVVASGKGEDIMLADTVTVEAP